MCLYLKAMLKSVLAERILTELSKQMHPEIESARFSDLNRQMKTSWTHIVEAAKIVNFFATVGLVLFFPGYNTMQRTIFRRSSQTSGPRFQSSRPT